MARPTASVGVDAVLVLAYVLVGWASHALAGEGTLTLWYGPAGLAVALGALHGARFVPALIVGELLVSMLVLDLVSTHGVGLTLLDAVVATALLAGGGSVALRMGGPVQEPGWRHPGQMQALATVAAPAAAAAVGIGVRAAAGALEGPALDAWFLAALGESLGVITLGVTVGIAGVRRARGERWWSVPDRPALTTAVAVVVPGATAVFAVVLGAERGTAAALAVLPYLYVAMAGGLPGVALSALPTGLVLTAVLRSGGDLRLEQHLLLFLLLAGGVAAGLLTDDRAALRRALRGREDHLVEAQRAARSGSWRWWMPTNELVFSEPLRELLGGTPPASGDAYLARVHPDDRASYEAAVTEALTTGGDWDAIHRYIREDGSVVHLRGHGRARLRDGAVLEVIGTSTDVTAEMRALEREREASAELAHIERVKHSLLVAVSHQVRTPLTLVLGMVETLRRAEFATDTLGDHADNLAALDRHARRLHDVLRDLLDVDRIGRGAIRPAPRPVDVANLVDEVLDGLPTPDCLVVDVPDVVATVDPDFLSRSLEELVRNAIRHAPPGPTAVRVAVTADRIRLVVTDEGPGILPDHAQRVFTPFTGGPREAASPGPGVGLFLVQRFAELHGGRAHIEDTATGCSISVTFATAPSVTADDAPPALHA